MSISAAIVSRYDNDTDAPALALRTALGVNKLWADITPNGVLLPYGKVWQVGPSTLVAECKGQTTRVDRYTMQLDVWASTKAEVESLLDLLEAAYWGKALTITNRGWCGSFLDGRMSPDEEKKSLWRGYLQLIVVAQKSQA